MGYSIYQDEVSIPLWFNSNLVKFFIASFKSFFVSQFHFGSIQTYRHRWFTKGLEKGSQFHFGSIQTSDISVVIAMGYSIVSIPLWFNSNQNIQRL